MKPSYYVYKPVLHRIPHIQLAAKQTLNSSREQSTVAMQAHRLIKGTAQSTPSLSLETAEQTGKYKDTVGLDPAENLAARRRLLKRGETLTIWGGELLIQHRGVIQELIETERWERRRRELELQKLREMQLQRLAASGETTNNY